ncbi:MAG: FAD-dependent oxidoreductase, partial [Nitrospiraceae bacterium]
MTHDVIIIGGGSAGYAAARTARDAGADVAIIDHGPLGGLCILRGCMPTKTILRSSDVIALMRRAKEFGLKPAATTADLAAIIDRKDRLVREFADDRIRELHDTQFTLYQEHATFRSTHEVQAGDQLLKAKAFIIATGSMPARLPIPGLEAAGYVTSDEVLDLRQ